MTEMPGSGANRQTSVLFMAWGYSIHARRRIQIFVDDPAFTVTVVSTHNYNFTGANNVLLTGALKSPLDNSELIKSPLCETPESAEYKKNIFKEGIRLFLKRLKLLSLAEKTYGLAAEIRRSLADLKILKKAVNDLNPDIIFLQTLLYPCYLSYFLPRNYPVLITFWNGDVTWWAKWTGIERLLKKKIVTYGVGRAQAMTVNSQEAFNACLSYGVEGKKVNLIRYPGVDMELFTPSSKCEARNRLGIKASDVVLCPRGLGAYLNNDVIAEALSQVINIRKDILFIFMGAASEEGLKRFKKLLCNLNVEENVHFAGGVSWEDMPLYYNASDLMISISSNDSLPNCMLEAMACGVPLIMGDIPQIREWVTNGTNGFLVPPRDSAQLADRILDILTGKGNKTDDFINKNLDLVAKEFDSRKNIIKIKELVNTIAGR